MIDISLIANQSSDFINEYLLKNFALNYIILTAVIFSLMFLFMGLVFYWDYKKTRNRFIFVWFSSVVLSSLIVGFLYLIPEIFIKLSSLISS